MSVEIKFCGLTRTEDAQVAAALGAAYLGVVLARSPRQLTVERAAALFAALDDSPARADAPPPRRVGVFAETEARAIARAVAALDLDIVQLHGLDDARLISALRDETSARLWAVLHVGSEGLDEKRLTSASLADGIVLDAKVEGMLGGTGQAFDWERVRASVTPLRGVRPIILAGGLRPENVARAIDVFAPDVVDVSSGVESSPGCKDPARMRAFADAVHGARRT